MSKADIGRRIRIFRESIDESRQSFASKFSCSEATLRSWEVGDTNISDVYLDKLMRSLHQNGHYISEDWLVKGIEPIFLKKTKYPKDCVVHFVTDDFNDPFLSIGDILIAKPVSLDEPELYLGKMVILQYKVDKSIQEKVYIPQGFDHDLRVNNIPYTKTEIIQRAEVISINPVFLMNKR